MMIMIDNHDDNANENDFKKQWKWQFYDGNMMTMKDI